MMIITVEQIQAKNPCSDHWIDKFLEYCPSGQTGNIEFTAAAQGWLLASEFKSVFGWLVNAGLLPMWSMRQANLSEANLSEANLRRADLWRSDLRGSDLRGSDLRRANLRRANLRGSNLSEANLSEANLEYVLFDEYTIWPDDFEVPN